MTVMHTDGKNIEIHIRIIDDWDISLYQTETCHRDHLHREQARIVSYVETETPTVIHTNRTS
jgi:hypothetical protein